jgi:endonuclease YncB( thermonuclease family)
MGTLAILAAGALCAFPSVHDGDSIRCGGERIRIANIDAPELPGSPKCEDKRRAFAWCDYQAGYRARDALQAFLSRGRVMIEPLGPDKYGRTLAHVTVNGEDAGRYLVQRGLARWWR